MDQVVEAKMERADHLARDLDLKAEVVVARKVDPAQARLDRKVDNPAQAHLDRKVDNLVQVRLDRKVDNLAAAAKVDQARAPKEDNLARKEAKSRSPMKLPTSRCSSQRAAHLDPVQARLDLQAVAAVAKVVNLAVDLQVVDLEVDLARKVALQTNQRPSLLHHQPSIAAFHSWLKEAST